jgi:hypothetical protein
LGNIQAAFREHPFDGIIPPPGHRNFQATFRERSLNMQWTLSHHSGNIQGTFREHWGTIQGTLPTLRPRPASFRLLAAAATFGKFEEEAVGIKLVFELVFLFEGDVTPPPPPSPSV